MAFRTKKISQMDPKGANLASTDLLEISELVSGSYVTKSITGAEIIASVPPSVTAWGTITGTLSSQTDLNTALSGKVPTTRTLTINGTTQDLSADRTFTISTGITIGTTAITSGTVGRVLFEGTGNVVSESANITYDNTNVLFALGSTATRILNFRPQDTTGAYGNSCSIRGGISNGRLDFYSASNITELKDNIIILTSVGGPSIQVGASSISLSVASATRLQVAPTTGNILIGTTTDAGYKLDVNGNTRSSRFYATDGITVGRISFDGFNNNTGIDYNSTTNLFRLFAAAGLNFLSAGFNLDTIIQPVRNTVDNIGDVVINGGGSERARFKANGNVGIGTSSPAQKLDVNGNTQITGNLIFPAGERLIQYGASSFFAGRDSGGVYLAYGFGSQQIDIGSISTGNIRLRTTANVILDNGSSKLLIGTSTDAGFKLDVNGTARVSGALTISTGGAVITGQVQANGGLKTSVVLNNTFNTNANSLTIFQSSDALGEARFHNSVCAGFVSTINTSAILQAESTTKGFLPPRMTTTQKNAVASPATGLQIYDSTLNRPCFYNGTSWITL